ncbi:uncharacterized protein LOC110357928 isoform X3 [Columba livia]|uniref:uncharacterized protein LOC110357928 isoform X3 n=1 Tax=Columba livia TaxID=8932 RepID=UPI0031B9FE34
MQKNVVKCLSFIAMTYLKEKRPEMLRWFKATVTACLCHLGRISEKARLGADSVFTAAVPDGGGGLGSSASSQRANVFTCNLFLNVQCLSCSGALRPSQWIGSSFGAEMHIDAHTRSDTAPHLSSRSDHGTPACMAEVQSNFDRKDRSERYGNMPACLKQITLCDYSANVRKSSVTFMVNFLVDRSLSTFKECESMVLWKLPAS